MKILLFGSTGLLGTHLLKVFLRRGWDTLAPHKQDLNLFDLSQVNNFVGPWLRRNPNSVVVYAAGLSNIAACDASLDNAQDLNLMAPFLLANLCSRVNARFVYFSTDQVFMDKTTGGFYQHHEKDPLYGTFLTTQKYGASKADAETFIGHYPNHLIIRTSWLFGDHPTRSNFVRDVIMRARNKEPIVGLHDYVACPSYAPDVAAATAQLLTDPDGAGTYHLVNGPAVNRFEMAKAILDHAGLSNEVTLATQAGLGTGWIHRNPNGALNNNRGPRLRPWTDGLRHYLKHLLPTLEGTPA